MDGQERRPLPAEPLECRQNAEQLLRDRDALPSEATSWALLAIAGELAEIRRALRRGKG
jgi:hypothetical protein